VVDNGGQVNNKKIYEIIEPDPDAVTSVRAVSEFQWAYPKGSFNTEAAFMSRGSLILVTKTSPSAQMYRFGTLNAGVVNKPTYIGKLMNSHSVSVARQSPDGKILVTASHEVVNLYRSTDGSGSLKSVGGKLPDCQMRAFPGDHVEAGEFVAGRHMRFITEIKRTFLLRID
jgi:hypothetical protein